MFFLQETWLSEDVPKNIIEGYIVLGQRHRSESENRGGILSLCRSDIFSYAVHVAESEVAERMWHYIVLESGVFVFSNWYRPGAATNDHIDSFAEELAKHDAVASKFLSLGIQISITEIGYRIQTETRLRGNHCDLSASFVF